MSPYFVKNTWFTRFASKEGITDGELKEALNLLEGIRQNKYFYRLVNK